ncbi:MAG: hypothetical protein R3211_05010, partial [Balneolaceae bacterium]|nr:hypothetical protein [Balneolaceae bacterium]
MFAVFLCPALLAGQNNQQGNQQSLLPEIDPQDIEIRSEFKARFPGLRRQPILGFETTMQVYQIDPNRKPFMETREEIVANLPISDLTRPSAPEYQFPPFAPSIQAYGEAGVGSYLSPEARFWGNYDISSRSSVGATLDYHSSDGHLDTRVSSFRFLNLDAEFATDLNAQSKLTVGAGLQSDFNRLFDPGLDPVFGVDLPLGSEKRYDGYNVQASFRQFRNTVEGWSADARFRSYEVTMDAGDLSGEMMESTYGGSIQKQWPGNNIQETFAARVKLRGGRYETDNLIEETWYTVSGGARYQRLFNYSTQLTAAFDLYAVSNLFEDKIHPAPSIEVKHWLSDNLVLSGQAKAQPQLVAHEKLHHLNRFLNT